MNDVDPFHGDLIRALGGKAKLAEALALDRGVVTRWHERGIPSKYWHQIIKLGAAMPEPIVVSAEKLASTKPAAQPAEAA